MHGLVLQKIDKVRPTLTFTVLGCIIFLSSGHGVKCRRGFWRVPRLPEHSKEGAASTGGKQIHFRAIGFLL